MRRTTDTPSYCSSHLQSRPKVISRFFQQKAKSHPIINIVSWGGGGEENLLGGPRFLSGIEVQRSQSAVYWKSLYTSWGLDAVLLNRTRINVGKLVQTCGELTDLESNLLTKNLIFYNAGWVAQRLPVYPCTVVNGRRSASTKTNAVFCMQSCCYIVVGHSYTGFIPYNILRSLGRQSERLDKTSYNLHVLMIYFHCNHDVMQAW